MRVRQIAVQLGIHDILHKFPYQTSGGQQQRCACARAMVNDPKLILADEPTGALDSRSSQMLLDTIQSMNEQLDATILMVTHDAFSASYTKRVLFLKDGRIFNEIYRGSKSRKQFFNEILDVMALLGGTCSMYAKMILRNIKRSRKDYLIYMVTLIFCVGLFYAFMALSSRYYNPSLGEEFTFSSVRGDMTLPILAITAILLFLIKYVNDYMIKRKQKEFAIQTILGMEQKTTAKLFL